jgi:peptide/nickel transport system ATP-binding protein
MPEHRPLQMEPDACAPDGTLLEVDGLRLEAGGRPLLDDVGFSVAAGSSLAIVGESGAGKTLLLRAVLGCLPPGVRRTAGSIRLAPDPRVSAERSRRRPWERAPGRPGEVEASRRGWLARLREVGSGEWARAGLTARPMGWVGQDAVQSFDPLRTVGQHLAEAGAPRHRWSRRPREIDPWLLRLGLPASSAACYARELSGGMARRAALAWALAGGARLLLADEPTTGIDPMRLLEVVDLLRSLRDEGVSLVLVTHDLRLAARAADQLVVLHRGRVVESGPGPEVLEGDGHPYVGQLVTWARALEDGPRALRCLPTPPPLFEDGCPYRDGCARRPGDGGSCATPPPLRRMSHARSIRCHHAEAE